MEPLLLQYQSKLNFMFYDDFLSSNNDFILFFYLPCLWPVDSDEILTCTMMALKEGHVVAVPTDTIYGLACLAQNAKAIRKIYDIKGRNGQKPLAICVGEIQDIFK